MEGYTQLRFGSICCHIEIGSKDEEHPQSECCHRTVCIITVSQQPADQTVNSQQYNKSIVLGSSQG